MVKLSEIFRWFIREYNRAQKDEKSDLSKYELIMPCKNIPIKLIHSFEEIVSYRFDITREREYKQENINIAIKFIIDWTKVHTLESPLFLSPLQLLYYQILCKLVIIQRKQNLHYSLFPNGNDNCRNIFLNSVF